MIKNKLTNEENNRKLLKLVEENPTLPIVFFADGEDICDDYSYTFMESICVEKGTIYKSEINNRIYTNRDEYCEELYDHYSLVYITGKDYYEEFKNLSDAEYEKEMQRMADKAPHYDAIIVYISNRCLNE